jgi:hypothetical protein
MTTFMLQRLHGHRVPSINFLNEFIKKNPAKLSGAVGNNSIVPVPAASGVCPFLLVPRLVAVAAEPSMHAKMGKQAGELAQTRRKNLPAIQCFQVVRLIMINHD